ncbi:hypothetical protein MHZ92_07885 [Sporosarcina sp. ACRSL]|uniref:hypothetical protein n=1 Tax=Sporosarcina sp. ACRSL TaxID=2918215 RepID=UPI001EF4D345|nr:hypothetical protein [Sporosarcina sp. ACRSL]MCG7344048.1 hypothetical protein [Sporosarcina sp. ACRSL]
MVEKQVIYVDGITSISESIFSFTNGKRLIEAEPLPHKVKMNPNQNSNYHLDAADLRKMYELEKSIFPYAYAKDMTKTYYIDYMKKKWIELMQAGRLLPLLEHVAGRSFEMYEIKWVGK